MTLLTSYPLLREDFEKWLEIDAPTIHSYDWMNGSAYNPEDMYLSLIEAQPLEIQHFYLSLYAESVGWSITREMHYGKWEWFTRDEITTLNFYTFPAAFEHFAQIREKQLNNK